MDETTFEVELPLEVVEVTPEPVELVDVEEVVEVPKSKGLSSAKAIGAGLAGAAAGGIITTYAVRGIDRLIGWAGGKIKTGMDDRKAKKLAKKEQKLLQAEEQLDREKMKLKVDKELEEK